MAQIQICFYGELNDFLSSERQQIQFFHTVKERTAIKDVIEALGIPHPEVDYIIVNRNPVNFSYLIQGEEQIEVYPISARNQFPNGLHLIPITPAETCFILDVHLGKLANSLRMLGFDTLYRNDYDDEELAKISASEQRILLTRDKGLLMRSLVNLGYYVRNTNPEQQLTEILQRYHLLPLINPLKRCIRCNGLLEPVEKNAILNQIPPLVQEQVQDFHRCRDCSQIYWQGSHYKRMQEFIQNLTKSGA